MVQPNSVRPLDELVSVAITDYLSVLVAQDSGETIPAAVRMSKYNCAVIACIAEVEVELPGHSQGEWRQRLENKLATEGFALPAANRRECEAEERQALTHPPYSMSGDIPIMEVLLAYVQADITNPQAG